MCLAGQDDPPVKIAGGARGARNDWFWGPVKIAGGARGARNDDFGGASAFRDGVARGRSLQSSEGVWWRQAEELR